MKKCTKCKVEKASSEFYTDRRSKNNLCSICKKCEFLKNKEYRKNHKENIPKLIDNKQKNTNHI